MLTELCQHEFYSLWMKFTLLFALVDADHGIIFKKNHHPDIGFVQHAPVWTGIGLIECNTRCLQKFRTSCSGYLYDKRTQTCIPGSCQVDVVPDPQPPPGVMYYKPELCGQTYPCVQYTEKYITTCLWVVESPQLSCYDAEEYCKSRGSHLYTMKVMEKLDILKRASLVSTGGYWIGLNDMEVENIFRWADDGQIMSQEQRTQLFKPNQPDDADPGEDCVVFVSGPDRLNDNKCHRQKSFICEKELD